MYTHIKAFIHIIPKTNSDDSKILQLRKGELNGSIGISFVGLITLWIQTQVLRSTWLRSHHQYLLFSHTFVNMMCFWSCRFAALKSELLCTRGGGGGEGAVKWLPQLPWKVICTSHPTHRSYWYPYSLVHIYWYPWKVVDKATTINSCLSPPPQKVVGILSPPSDDVVSPPYDLSRFEFQKILP